MICLTSPRLLSTAAAVAAAIAFLAPARAGAQTITSPTTAKTIVPWEDYATSRLRDPWDMATRTDIGFYTWGVDLPGSNMTGKQVTTDAFGNTIFTGTAANGDPSIFLLDTPSSVAASIGKLGSNYPIDTAKYTRLLVRMRLQNEIKPPQFSQLGTVPVMQLYWSRDSIYYVPPARPLGGTLLLVDGSGNQVGIPFDSLSSEPFGTVEGGRYVIYSIPIGDINALKTLNPNISKWKNVNANNPSLDVNWGTAGITADSFRFKFVNLPGSVTGPVDIDWVRLVAPAADPLETVSWSGGGTYDIIISTATDCGASNGNYAVIAHSKTTGFQFHPQQLPNGRYYVGLRDRVLSNGADTPASRQVRACSAGVNGSYTVVDYPVFDFTSPNPIGSADDYATVFLNNKWDFDTVGDVDLAVNLAGPLSTATVAAERIDGTSLGNVSLMFGNSLPPGPGSGDPYIYPLHPYYRGLNQRIDTTRYRLFTADVGLDTERDLLNGSIMRLVWHIAGETWFYPGDGGTHDAPQVTTDIPLYHFRKGTAAVDSQSPRYALDRVQLDMADRFRVPLELAADGSPSRTGWSNNAVQCGGTGCFTSRVQPFNRVGVDTFRIDFHEFTPQTQFFIREARLAAHERSTNQFTISWTHTLAPLPTTGTYASAANWKVRLYAVRTKPESSPGAGNASAMTPATQVCTSGLGTNSIQITPNGSEPALSAGSYVWNAAATGGLVNGGLYFICAGLMMPGQTTPVVFSLSQWPIIYDTTATSTPLARLVPDRGTVWMAARHNGATLTAKTPVQTINVTQIGGASPVNWLVEACVNDPSNPPPCTGAVSFIQLSQTSGLGSGSFTVQLVPSAELPVTTGAGAVGVLLRIREASAGTTSNSPQFVQIYVKIFGPNDPSNPPIGQVDLPAQSAAGVQGAIGVTGWAIDDIGIQAVRIYRNCAGPEACVTGVVPGAPSTPVILLGQSTFLAGARPDIEVGFPSYPANNEAGYGYAILTNMLPRTTGAYQPYGGQGPFTLYVIAVDVEGQSTLLGRSWVNDHTPTFFTADNDSIAKPFGVIDTPGQGGTASGASYANFGWALTPDNGTGIQIPTNGSTMVVFIDGMSTGLVAYNQCRGTVGNPPPVGVYCNDDVANIFGNVTPQPPLQTRTSNPSRFRNLDAHRGAIGAFVINTNNYSNGLHSIAWSVTDSAGRVEGIGSRLFRVANGGSQLVAESAPDLGGAASALDVLERVTAPVGVRKGYNLNDRPMVADVDAGVVVVNAPAGQRVDLELPDTPSGATWRGYLVVGGKLTALPVGSALDERGRFQWQPVAANFGSYELLFVRENPGGLRETLPVRVTFSAPTPSTVRGPATKIQTTPGKTAAPVKGDAPAKIDAPTRDPLPSAPLAKPIIKKIG